MGEMNQLDTHSFKAGAWAMAIWIYNTSAVRFVEIAYGQNHAADYLEEKTEEWVKSPVRALSSLGAIGRARVLKNVMLFSKEGAEYSLL